MANWLQSKSNPVTWAHALRTAAAALISLELARLFRIPDPHWAPISTLVVMQTNFGTSLPISIQRFVGTAVGAVVGGLAGTCWPGNPWAFGAAVLVIGALCAALQAERPAYRYASITLAIIVLIPRMGGAWPAALDRFIAVSLGIAVGLVCSAHWPEHPAK